MGQDRCDRKVDHKSDGFQRLEVITGGGRRRRWLQECKAAVVAESSEMGAVVSDVARRHGCGLPTEVCVADVLSPRLVALNRKNALLAGSDEGGANWAIVASLIETCKLNGVNLQAWLTGTLTKLVNRWPASGIDELMPWSCVKIPDDVVKV